MKMNVPAETTGLSSDTSLRPNSTLSDETLSATSSVSSDEHESLELEDELAILREDGLYHQFRTLLSSGKSRGGRSKPSSDTPPLEGGETGIKTRSRAPVPSVDLFSSDENDDDYVVSAKAGFGQEIGQGDPGFVDDMGQDPLEPFLPEGFATPSDSSSSDEELDVVDAEEVSECLKDVEVPLVMRNEAALRFPFLWRTKSKLADVDENASHHTDSDPDFELVEEDFDASSSSEDEEYDTAREEDIADMIAHLKLNQNEDEMVEVNADEGASVFVVEKSPGKEDPQGMDVPAEEVPEGAVVYEHYKLAESIFSFKEESYKDEEDSDFEPDEFEMESEVDTDSASESESQVET
ncbi:hypothetical protein TCAL_12606 [Tigriopus californicus]|uniref:Uncharacterized protein n=1 Tax=Tigriopus californicus TaxID=6832 RepID=A0A553PPP7_TIGCA|nr:uncharacterized protein LOC131882436 [Tigriopus californicus]TRY79646.1 hypothetical protein TCAL_12606 [Tigriopus californicus]|eukprot:TCALIF_12606-PA protein Name:"Protein of unknown function" AED:0.00 eAED:0.00 QI:115/1/1/1/1/1/5/138/351